MNTLNYINISHAENIERICMNYLEDILKEKKSKLSSSIKLIGLIGLTPINYIYSIYSVNRFSVNYIEHLIKVNNWDEKAIKIFIKKEYYFFLKVKAIPLYYYKWEKNTIEECFEYFDRIYSFKQFTEVTRKRSTKFSKFDYKHLPVLFKYLKELKIFKSELTLEILNNLFIEEKLEKPLEVNNNREFSHFFAVLKKDRYLSSNWGNIVGKKELFISDEGNILETGDISSAKHLHHFDEYKWNIIKECRIKLQKC